MIDKGKSLALAVGLLTLSDYVSLILKKDSDFYIQRNKQLLNQIILNNKSAILKLEKATSLLFESDKVKSLYEEAYEKETGNKLEYDPNIVLDDLNLIQNTFRLFLRVCMTATPTESVSLYQALDNLNNKKRLYTEEEMQYKKSME